MEQSQKRIEDCKKEIEIYKEMINLTNKLIELNDNKDGYVIEELENSIKTYEKSIKNRLYRLFIIWSEK